MPVDIVCPDCETRTGVEKARVGAALQRHNERAHDGEAIAHVAPEHIGRFAA